MSENPNRQNSELNFSEVVELIDISDFIEVTGVITKTPRGEISIMPSIFRILTKAIRAIPQELKDKEIRFRQRYLDTNIHQDVFDRFIRRSKFWKAHRDFFAKNGFIEMNIPVLESVIGGGDATPFVTHMNAIDEDFYLRISQELPLKRLIGAGYEKVYEIGPRFRNEGLSDEHLPEHISMEFYWAYADWKDGMKFIQDLINYVIGEVYPGKTSFDIRGFKDIKFGEEWEILDFKQVFKDKFGIEDVYNVTQEEVEAKVREHIKDVDFQVNIPRGVDNLWKLIRKEVKGPAFLINHPKYLSPLQKPDKENPLMVNRFQPIIAGSELGNGWSEITDALDQFDRFADQEKLRESGDKEAQMMDVDYVEMLEYGMPPTFGWGHSERLFWFLEDVSAKEGVIFPAMKHEISEETKKIYGIKEEAEIVELNLSKDISGLPSIDEAEALLDKHVKDVYQRHHSRMIALALGNYAIKYSKENPDLWYITGLLHDLDYDEFPNEHPLTEVSWFKKLGYPEQMIHAIEAHAITKIHPQTELAKVLMASDELSGFLYAYSLLRPQGYGELKSISVLKKLKDVGFAPKINRHEVNRGLQYLNISKDEFIEFLAKLYLNFEKEREDFLNLSKFKVFKAAGDSVKNKIDYSISKEIQSDFPGISFAYVKISDIDIKKSNKDLEEFKKSVIDKYSKILMDEISNIGSLVSYRDLFKKSGTDFHSKRPSPEALLRRVIQGKGIYNINTAVDAYNLAVLETHVGLGGFDFDQISEPVVLRYSEKDEKMKLLGDDDITLTREGQVIYADSNGPITIDLNYRDIDKTKIIEKTKNIILFADGGVGISEEDIMSALKKGAEYIEKYCGGEIGEAILIK